MASAKFPRGRLYLPNPPQMSVPVAVCGRVLPKSTEIASGLNPAGTKLDAETLLQLRQFVDLDETVAVAAIGSGNLNAVCAYRQR